MPTPRPDEHARVVILAGASGTIGRPLERHLSRRGYDVRRLVRRPPRAPSERQWDPAAGELDPRVLDGAHSVVNLGGVNAGRFLWTRSFKERFVSSRVDGTSLLAKAAATVERPPTRFVQASASGYYGDRGDEVLDESASSGGGFFADMVRRWEAAADPARAAGIGVVHLRSHLVLVPGSGAMGRMLPIFRLGVGGRLGPGSQWWGWITLVDEVRAILHLLDSDATGPVNVTAPHPVRNRDATRALARALHRPALLPVPRFALRIIVGEFAAEVLSSRRLVPGVLAAEGFAWRHPTIDNAMAWVVSQYRRRPPHP